MNTLTSVDRFAIFVASFPALKDAPGTFPWDAHRLVKWARSASHGEQLAAKFVLGVWNPGTDWSKVAGVKFSRFDLFEAMNVWDDAQIAAAVAWMRRPFFP